MHNKTLTTLLIATVTTGLSGVSLAQTPAPAPAQPLFATTKVEGTENVYIFRYQNHQAMFVVTPAGVIATDRSATAGRRRRRPISRKSAKSPRPR